MQIRILLIEDNPDHVIITEKALQKANPSYYVDSVPDGEEGIKRIMTKDYDLVLCDFRLPQLSGLDVLREMKRAGKDLPFVVITSAGSEKVAVELMKEGAYDYVVKDYEFENILPVVVDQAIEKHRTKKEKERLERQLRETNKKLKQMYELKSEFASLVSHELRTPLTAIMEGLGIVLEGTVGQINEKQREFLELAKRNLERLREFADKVLDFSKLEARKLVFHIREGNIVETVDEVARSQRPLAEARGLYLNVEAEDNIPRIKFDSGRIMQVLNNLISNAIKFTQKGGITISVARGEGGKGVVVSVRDTGKGIPRKDLAKLFERFQQAGGDNVTQGAGAGLGLAICKEIIKQHRGKIWAESEVGKGSEFRFFLPG